MKENKFFSIVKNTALILKHRASLIIFLAALLFFISLFAFFYGFITIPVPGGVLGFYRMTPPTFFEKFYMIFSAVVSALIATITIHSAKMKMKSGAKGKGVSAAGLATGIFGAVCPACLGINFLAFGNVFTAQLSFLIPYIFWIQVGGIVLLSAGLYFVAKSAYEKKCLSCAVDGANAVEVPLKESGGFSDSGKKYAALAIIAAVILAYQLVSVFRTSAQIGAGSTEITIKAKNGEKINLAEIIEAVTPKAGFETNVKWNGIVAKMVKAGVLDPAKLENILAKRYGQEMKPEWRAILEGKGTTLSINNENAVFMMYVLWTFAKHNKNQILADSPFAKYFTNYDIGVGRAGYNDTPLLALTPDQQLVAKEVAANAYRPCCGNSTAAPDCSHGYSALGLVELMAAQGFSKSEIFETFVQFNSFWFPETYIKNAIYFKVTEGKDWSDVSKELVAGEKYSTLRGSYSVKNYLKTNFGI